MNFGPRRRSVCARLLLISLIVTCAATAETPKTEPGTDDPLYALAPYVAQVINLALFDPNLAAGLVPDPWIDSLTEGVLKVESEIPIKRAKADAPQTWPLGPWTTPASLAASIDAVQPRAVASLYTALRPRFALQCQKRGTSIDRCEDAMRITIARLSAPSIRARAIGHRTTPVTPTQRALAQLGEPVVVSVNQRLQDVQRALWGNPGETKPAPNPTIPTIR
jgi:hypothetical protein